MAEKISCFEMNTMFRNFRALNTFSTYLNIFKIRVLIQITRQNTNGSIKEQPFLRRGSKKLYSSHQEKKKGTSM